MAKTAVAFAALAAALLLLLQLGGAAADGGLGSSCTRTCGSVVDIPYPFGIEPGCFHSAGFDLTCNHSYQPPKLFLGGGTAHEVLGISLDDATMSINSSRLAFRRHGAVGGEATTSRTWGDDLPLQYFLSEETQHMVRAEGCNIHVELRGGTDDKLIGACVAICLCSALRRQVQDEMDIRDLASRNRKCEGVGCCEANINAGYSFYKIQMRKLNLSSIEVSLGEVTIVDENYTETSQASPKATLSWIVAGNSTCPANVPGPECHSAHSSCLNMTKPGTTVIGYVCRCSKGYKGNPYISDGCEALSIGLGVSGGTTLLLLVLGAPFIVRKIKQRKVKRTREKFFYQNHGLLLQQLISNNVDIGERMIIPLRELEKATNNFDKARVVGAGAHGVVFKGIIDLRVVAIKRPKIVVQREINEFINEVAILSQVNHRNVVKLLGCCLEAEVPLLVYEFVSNGTLHQHLHVETQISLSWTDRIRIALEVARAISYLHSAASMPIFHRDIKSSNILLDDNLTAKVSDFGASKYIPIDQTGITTAVQGTIGYLDPMYYYTGRLTDKSDVFSFGVLLVELLTRKQPFIDRSKDGDSLVSHFVRQLERGNLIAIIDPQVIAEEHGEVQEVAILATMCTKLREEDRPTMREVGMTLENLLDKKKHVPRITVPRRHDGVETLIQYMPIEPITGEASRQYTMEEEILLSARYPR